MEGKKTEDSCIFERGVRGRYRFQLRSLRPGTTDFGSITLYLLAATQYY